MRIYIHSHKRAEAIYAKGTLAKMPEELYERCTLVIYEEELQAYQEAIPFPFDYQFCTEGYGRLYKFIYTGKLAAERNEPIFCMLDDDLTFYKRKEDVVNLIRMVPDDYFTMFDLMEELVTEKYSHVGISSREGNNHVKEWCAENGRILRAAAFRTEDYNLVDHRLQFMADFDMTLQLLRMGKKNCNIYKYAQNHFATQAKGGCSEQRTLENHYESLQLLASHHPGFVNLIRKENKTGGEFGKRTEARIAWQKAYKSSQQAGLF